MNDKTSRDMQKTILERVIEKTQTRTLRGFTSREEIINEDGNKIYKQTIVMYYEGQPSEETPEDSSSVCGDCASYPGCSTVEGGSVDYHGPVCGGFTQSDCAPVGSGVRAGGVSLRFGGDEGSGRPREPGGRALFAPAHDL